MELDTSLSSSTLISSQDITSAWWQAELPQHRGSIPAGPAGGHAKLSSHLSLRQEFSAALQHPPLEGEEGDILQGDVDCPKKAAELHQTFHTNTGKSKRATSLKEPPHNTLKNTDFIHV